MLNPLALLGLLFLPLLIVLYLFRPDPRRQQSTSYFLWKAAVPESAGGTFANRLQSNPLLWLQLLFLLLVLLFLCRLATPWISQKPASNRVILLIDRSASMQAEDAFERARESALEAVDQMLGVTFSGSSTEVMLIAVDREPRVLVPFTKDEATLTEALESLEATDLPDGLDELGPFVRSLVKAHRAQVWVFSDHLPESLRVAGVQYSSMAGGADDNAGIVSFSVRAPDPERGQDRPFVYARVENFSGVAQQRLLKVEKVDAEDPRRAEATVLEQSLLIPVGAGETIIQPVSAARFAVDKPSLFRLTLSPLPGQDADVLSSDDVAYTVVPPFREEKILVATAEGAEAGFLLRAIAASSDVKVITLAEYRQQANPDPLNLLIVPEGFRLPSGLQTRSLFVLSPNPGDEKTPVERLAEVEEATPLVGDSGVEWTRQKVQITGKAPLKEGETTLLQTQSGPALTLGLESGLPTLHWRFPLSYSSLPLSSGLPVIVGRFLDGYSRHTGVPFPGSISTGQTVTRPNGQSWKGDLEFEPLSGQEAVATMNAEATLLFPPPRVGVYSLVHAEGAQPVAVNLSSYQESRLPRDAEDLNFGEVDGPAQEQAKGETLQYRVVGLPFLIIAFLVLLAEAFVFLKRGRP